MVFTTSKKYKNMEKKFLDQKRESEINKKIIDLFVEIRNKKNNIICSKDYIIYIYKSGFQRSKKSKLDSLNYKILCEEQDIKELHDKIIFLMNEKMFLDSKRQF